MADNDLTHNIQTWEQRLAPLHVTRVTELDQALELAASKAIDCVWIQGSSSFAVAETMAAIQRVNSSVPAVVCSPDLTAAGAVRLAKLGAYQCFSGSDDPEEIVSALISAIDESSQRSRAIGQAHAEEPWRRFLIGDSRPMQQIASLVRLIGSRRSTVLITGETGTGKEMAARALHMASPRAASQMVAVNCSALPEHLLEAELFGHVKGAFTGAINARVGRFEQAHKSTLFLDEIGDMPLDLQAKLLRVLQEKEIQRLGSSETIKVDVRVIAASNVDLEERIRQGRFREDLYYRLNVVPMQMPPLRERTSDIPALVHFFVDKVCKSEGIPVKRISQETMVRLCRCPWPGNVRQLENTVEMAVALSGDRELLLAADFRLTNESPVVPLKATAGPTVEFNGSLNLEQALSTLEFQLLEQALRKTGGNKTAAADLLGLKRTTLIMKLRNYRFELSRDAHPK
ncbi:MAG: sigma-54 dependent transcriptional regulator [Bryobacteraceae bacterium]